MEVAAKMQRLQGRIAPVGRAVVAFSGGSDSAFLAEMAHRILGSSALAVTADSPSLKRTELAAAVALAKTRGWIHEVVETSEMQDDRYASNQPDRCYWCKSALMDRLRGYADAGWVIMLGTNVDDLSEHRPGQRAASEAGAKHPLVEAGFSKAEVRHASTLIGLPTHDKPAQACMASRIAYGTAVTVEALHRIEMAEQSLIDLGFGVVRVRDLGQDRCRIEVDAALVHRAREDRVVIESLMRRSGFQAVSIDERGYRSGSMNELLTIGRGPIGD